jgi:hypothetical protein
MKSFISIAAIAVALALVSCSDDNPSEPEDGNPDISQYSGSFMVTDTLEFNDCAIPAPLGATVNVIVEGDSIFFGGFWGDWDEATLTGGGTSPETTVPVDPPTCYAYYTVTFEITYANADTFYGTYGVSNRKDATCPNPDPCSYLYRIRGAR